MITKWNISYINFNNVRIIIFYIYTYYTHACILIDINGIIRPKKLCVDQCFLISMESIV